MLGTAAPVPVSPATAAGAVLPRLAELPFFERDLYELLGFELGREALDLEYTGFGWARPTRIYLESVEGGGKTEVIEQPLLLALHSADDAPALPGDILLELVIDDETGAAIATSLSRFLEAWLPRLPPTQPIVLALCNPHRAILPPLPAGQRVWYGVGDVDSWLDPLDGPAAGPDEARAGGRFRLSAPAWRVA